jgi:hypothetical protein
MEIKIHIFLTSALDADMLSASRFDGFILGKRNPSMHFSRMFV